MSLGTSTLVHIVTLPTEFDASFGRALPIVRTPVDCFVRLLSLTLRHP